MKNDDKILRDLFKENLIQAPKNPWFVKKVMNRLPEKRPVGMYSWIEYLAYALSIGILGGLALYTGYGICQSDEITVGNVFSMMSIGFMILVVSVGFFLPAVKQWISED